MPFFTEWNCASSFEVILARQSTHFPTWASASRTLGSRCIFDTLLRRKTRRRIRLCWFARLFVSCRKLELSPFEHSPLAFHYEQSPGLLCSRSFTLWFLTTYNSNTVLSWSDSRFLQTFQMSSDGFFDIVELRPILYRIPEHYRHEE